MVAVSNCSSRALAQAATPAHWPARVRRERVVVSEKRTGRFIFFAPFRTNVETDIFSALSDTEVDNLIFKVACGLNRAEEGRSQWITERGAGRGDKLLFANLDEHVLPRKAKPIVCLEVCSKDLEQLSSNARPPAGASKLTVTECTVRYYDDTIAILVCRVGLEGLLAGDIGSIDAWSTEFCQSLVDKLRVSRTRLEKALYEQNETRWRHNFFGSLGRSRRLADHNRGSSVDGRSMLWVTRVLVAEDEPDLEAIQSWTQTDAGDENDWLGLESMRLLACVGNSVLAGRLSERDVSVTTNAVALCTFFYVYQDLFRLRLKELQLEVARTAKGISRKSLSQEELGELRDRVVIMEGEFWDCRLGLQGHMREVALRFLNAWNYDALSTAVERRSTSLETAWSLLREKRVRKYNSTLQLALTTIAGLAIMDFILSLFAAAGAGKVPDDGVIGPIDAARMLPPDLMLNIALLLICALPLLVIRGRK